MPLANVLSYNRWSREWEDGGGAVAIGRKIRGRKEAPIFLSGLFVIWIALVLVSLLLTAGSSGFHPVAIPEVRAEEGNRLCYLKCSGGDNNGGGVVSNARIVLGGIAPTPYRAVSAEEALIGRVIAESAAETQAKAAVSEAVPLSMNAYKVPITESLVKRAIME